MRCLIIFTLVFVSINTKAQDTLSYKDGEKFAVKPVMTECIREAEKTEHGNATAYCDCIIKLVAKHFTSAEIKQLMSANKVNGATILFGVIQRDEPDEFYACAKASVSSEKHNWTKDQEDVFYRGCIMNLPKDEDWHSRYDGDKYCKCTILKMKNRYSDKELLDMKNNPELLAILKECLENSKKEQAGSF